GRAREAMVDPLGDDAQRRIERAQVAMRERIHHEATLRTPGAAFGREQALEAHLAEDRLDIADAPVGLGPRAQHLVRDRRIADDEEATAAHTERIDAAVLFTPPLEDVVEAIEVGLERIAEERQ